jgi:hypothetical protein
VLRLCSELIRRASFVIPPCRPRMRDLATVLVGMHPPAPMRRWADRNRAPVPRTPHPSPHWQRLR